MRVIAFAVMLLLLSYGTATAFCFEEAGATYGISPQLLWAIAKVESNFNPVAVNHNSNGTYDFGVMQINSSWAKILGKDIWQSLADPCTNVKTGAWVLAICISKYGYNWEAVGCYNAVNKNKRAIYANKVYNIIAKYQNVSPVVKKQ